MSEQEISGKWKKIFVLIDKAGGVDDKTWDELPLAKNLLTGERMAIGFNVWGFIFGVFYYLYLRMWKKGIFLFGIISLVMVFLELFESVFFPDNKLLKKLAAASYFLMPVFFATRANIDYYKKIFAHGKAEIAAAKMLLFSRNRCRWIF